MEFCLLGAVHEGTCVPNAMPGVSRVATVGSRLGSHMRKLESVNSNILLRTVSLQVLTILSPVRVVGGRSSGQGIGRSREMMWLQLMCCALLELPSSQFTRGRIVD